MERFSCEEGSGKAGMLMKDGVENLQKRMSEFAEIGREKDGGISRTFGSSAMEQGIRMMQEYFRNCGMKTYVDSVGNVHGILEGSDQDAGELLVGIPSGYGKRRGNLRWTPGNRGRCGMCKENEERRNLTRHVSSSDRNQRRRGE